MSKKGVFGGVWEGVILGGLERRLFSTFRGVLHRFAAGWKRGSGRFGTSGGACKGSMK